MSETCKGVPRAGRHSRGQNILCGKPAGPITGLCLQHQIKARRKTSALSAARDEVVRAAVAWEKAWSLAVAGCGPFLDEAIVLANAVAALARLEKP